MGNYFDTHCHLDFLSNTDLAVGEARACGVNRILVPSVHTDNFSKVIKLADRYEGIYYTLGIHPYFVAKTSENALNILGSYTPSCNWSNVFTLFFFLKTFSFLRGRVYSPPLLSHSLHYLGIVLVSENLVFLTYECFY